jgi:tetratricopeptide (TPR) repeat protein
MRHIYLLLSLSFLLMGCDKDAKTLDSKEERNPLVKQGQAYMEIKDYGKAEEAFKQAIETKPNMARPHLDLATIYHQYKPDYISSIFYYKRYLELRPDSEKTEFINEQIQKVQLALANAILTQSGAVKAIQELKQLQQENAALKQQVKSLTNRNPAKTSVVSQVAPQKSVTQTIPKTAKPASSTQPNHQIYHVVSGDTLSKVSSKFYGDSGKWDAIYQANKDRMKNAGDLRVGQTIIIPALNK